MKLQHTAPKLQRPFCSGRHPVVDAFHWIGTTVGEVGLRKGLEGSRDESYSVLREYMVSQYMPNGGLKTRRLC